MVVLLAMVVVAPLWLLLSPPFLRPPVLLGWPAVVRAC
jgi:hypothetical protein